MGPCLFLPVAHTPVQIIDASLIQNFWIFDPTREDKSFWGHRCVKGIDPSVIWIQYDTPNESIALGMVAHLLCGQVFSGVNQKCFYVVLLCVMSQSPQAGGHGIGDGAVRAEKNGTANF